MKKNECVIIGQMDNFDFKFPDQNSFNLNDILHDPDMQTLFRLAVYGSLTRKFIHEINNSLTGIIGFNSLLLRNQDLSEKERVYVEKILSVCKNAQNTNQSFFNLFPHSQKVPAVNTIQKILEELAANLFVLSAHQCEIHCRVDHTLANQNIRETGIREMMLYLMIYLIDIVPNCRDIEIRAKRLSEQNHDPNRDKMYVIHLTPTEYDIPADDSNGKSDSETLFFKREGGLDEKMALTISSHIAHQLSGEITHQKNSDGIPCFQVVLPIDEQQELPPGSPPGLEESRVVPLRSNIAPLNILILEDQLLIAEFIQSFLEPDGHRITVYRNGRTFVQNHPDLHQFNLFLLDIFVPGMSGLEVAQFIRGQIPQAPLIFYSALADEDSIRNQFEMNEQTFFLRKPFQKEELLNILKNIRI